MNARLTNDGRPEHELRQEQTGSDALIRVEASAATPTDLTTFAANRQGNLAALPSADSTIVQTSRSLLLVQFVSFAGIVTFVVAVGALHGLHRDLNPMQHTISEYSLSTYGWLMRAAFASLGLGAVAAAVGLGCRLESPSMRRAGMVLLISTGVGLFLDAGFNTDRLQVAETFDGAVHGDGMLIVCLSLPAAALILGSAFLRSTPDRRQARCLQALGLAQLGAIWAFEISPITVRGLTERMAVAMGVASLALLQSLIPSRLLAQRSSRNETRGAAIGFARSRRHVGRDQLGGFEVAHQGSVSVSTPLSAQGSEEAGWGL